MTSSPLRGARRLGLVGLAALVVTLVGFAPVPAAAVTAEPERPRLLVIGDSIILGTGGNIAAQMPEWEVVFDAAESRSTADGLDVLARHGTDFDVVVVALGANDGESPAVFTPRVAALLDALAGVPHVVWVTINEARPYYVGANQVIRDHVGRYPNAVVGDWNAAAAPGDVGGDGLHLTGQGSVAMAAWVAAVVRLTVLGAPPATTTTTTSTTTTSTTTTTTTSTTTTTTPAATTATSSAPAVATGSASQGGGGSWTTWGLPVIGLSMLVSIGAALAWRRRGRTTGPSEPAAAPEV